MENYEEKIQRKFFWSMFGWVRRKENKWWNPGVFFLGPLKTFLPKMERKLKRKIGHLFLDKNSHAQAKQHRQAHVRRQAHVQLHMGLSTLLCFIFFCFSLLLDVDLGIFFPIPPKNFLPKIERKLKKKIGHHFWTKIPMCNCTWPCLRCSSSFFIFYLFLFLSSWTLPLFFLLLLLSFVFLFFFFGFFMWFCFLFRCEFFFLDMIFIFFNKFRWFIFL